MMTINKKLNAMYFSPTDTTRKIVLGISKGISEMCINAVDFTLPETRVQQTIFDSSDCVIIGVPVYAGRVPNVLLEYLNSIKGNGASAVSVVVYGNRNFDDALIELNDILKLNDFKIIASGAFIGEHSFSNTLAKSRPDRKDMAVAYDFSKKIVAKLLSEGSADEVFVKGTRPYKAYYKPKNKDGIAVDIRKVSPKTSNTCSDCKLCVAVCPMGSIDISNVSKINGICIKCGACIKKCPVHAKYFDDADYLMHKHELEVDFASRREPELFL